MGGYLSTSGSWSVSDAAQGGYTGTVTGTLKVTADAGSSCSWSVSVSHPNYNYFRIYLAIDGVVCKDEYKKISNTKSTSYSGTATISGDDVSITFGLSASVNSTSTSYMSYTYPTLTRTKWTDVSAGTVSVTDNGNNTFAITGYKGTAGTNNSINKSTLEWTVTNANGYWWTDSKGKYKTKDFTGNSGSSDTWKLSDYGANTSATRQVAARVGTDGVHNDAWPGYTYVDIKQYIAPTTPSTAPALTAASKKNNRLTTRQNWEYTWGASAKQGYSGVAGYAVAVWKNGSKLTGLGYSKRTITLNSNNKNDWVDIPGTTCSVTINPTTLGFKAGDTVGLSVWGYSENGTSTKTKLYSAASNSATTTVKNAGVMRVKASGGWKEGRVWVKVSGSWKEADLVSTKVGGSWKDSI